MTVLYFVVAGIPVVYIVATRYAVQFVIQMAEWGIYLQ